MCNDYLFHVHVIRHGLRDGLKIEGKMHNGVFYFLPPLLNFLQMNIYSKGDYFAFAGSSLNLERVFLPKGAIKCIMPPAPLGPSRIFCTFAYEKFCPFL